MTVNLLRKEIAEKDKEIARLTKELDLKKKVIEMLNLALDFNNLRAQKMPDDLKELE